MELSKQMCKDQELIVYQNFHIQLSHAWVCKTEW